MDRRTAASIYYEKLLREQPESIHAEEGALELIDVWLEMGEPEKARQLVEQIEATRPGTELAGRARALLEN